MNQKTAPLTIISETEALELLNKSGEPYVLHKLKVKSSTKGREFSAIMFGKPNQKLELGKEKTYIITEGIHGDWVIRELRDTNKYGSRKINLDKELEIWRISMQTAAAIATNKTVPDIMMLAQKFVTELKSKMK